MIVKSIQTIGIGLIIGLFAIASRSLAHESGPNFEADPRQYLAEESIDDPEAVEGDFGERVRVMQEWLRRREAERRHQNWGLDVVSPEERPVSSSSTYFKDHGYDERGFRRLDGNVRVKLRGLQDDSEQQTHPDRRHSSPAKGKADSKHH